MQAVIMAGGKGTRLASVTKDIPKPMVSIAGKPLLESQIENLRECGVKHIILVVGYLGNVIKDYFQDGKRFWGRDFLLRRRNTARNGGGPKRAV